jgi:hypothetical protein
MSGMTEEQNTGLPSLVVNGVTVPTLGISEFYAEDQRRVSSFVIHFGDWQLPEDAATAMNSDVAHLEWFHDTGELVLIGDIPESGVVEEEVPAMDTTEDNVESTVGEFLDPLAGPFGGSGMVRRTHWGAVKETVLGEVVESDTRVAILSHIKQRTRAHELMWGWHRKHRKPDGWDWLQERLASHH